MVYGRNRLGSPQYLIYVPGKNAALGSAYLSLLTTRSFKQILGRTKRLYLVICACYWGPGAVTRKIVRKNNISLISSHDLYQILRQKTPEETSNYLKRVTKRMDIYARLYQ
jgi:hypothetical protein